MDGINSICEYFTQQNSSRICYNIHLFLKRSIDLLKDTFIKYKNRWNKWRKIEWINMVIIDQPPDSNYVININDHFTELSWWLRGENNPVLLTGTQSVGILRLTFTVELHSSLESLLFWRDPSVFLAKYVTKDFST